MPDFQISSKLPNVGTTIFTVMSALATEHKAVNLGQGFPDYPMPEALTELVSKAMQNGYNQYAPMPGWMPLRESIAEKIKLLYQTTVNPDTEITITPGGTYAIYTALTTVLQPGDEVIVFEPAYDSYIPNIEVNGAIPVLIDLKFPEYRIDWNEVRQKITPRTRMIMLNTPHNPTGAVLREEDIQQLRSVVKDTKILILSDEVYEHLIFDQIPHQSMLRYPDLLQRSFVCFSFNCFSCHTPSQVALADFLKDRQSYLQLSPEMQHKRDYFSKLMTGTRFTPLPSYGSYFQCYKYDRISEESDKDFAIRITKEYGIATIPVSAFYQSGKDDKVIRFCFAKKETTVEQAVERLRKI